MSTFVNTSLPKLCHARVGQKIRLPDPKTGEVLPEVYVVVAIEAPRRRPARANMSHGLYDEGRELLLVSMETGMVRKTPHLSSRAELLRNEDLAETLGQVSVLVPEPKESWYQVQVALPKGNVLTRAINVADEKEVCDLLGRLQSTAGVVLSFQEASARPTEEQLMALWRKEVAAGETLLSFAEYKEANA